MLSPDTIKALDDALSAVIDEAGEDPQYAGLAEALSSAQGELQGLDAGGPAEVTDDPTDEDADFDPHSFDAAEKQMTKRRKPAPFGGDKPEEEK